MVFWRFDLQTKKRFFRHSAQLGLIREIFKNKTIINLFNKLIYLQEFKRGYQITKSILENNGTWDKLFEKDYFFKHFSYFVVIEISAPQENALITWFVSIGNYLMLFKILYS